MNPRSLRIPLLAVLAMALLPTALASAHAHVALTLPKTADAGSALPATWTASGLPSHARLVIQRQQGTTHSWRTAQRLTTPTGSVSLAGLPLGKYRLRIAALGSQHRVYAQQARSLAVFGAVPLLRLFRNMSGGLHTGGGVATTSTHTFKYAFWAYPFDGGPSWTAAHNHCRSIHFDYLMEQAQDYGSSGSAQGNMRLVQETLDPQEVTVPVDTIGAFDATLVPGKSWSMYFANITNDTSLNFYLNGSAMCDSTAPLA